MPGIHGLRAVAAVGVMLMHTAAVASLSLPPVLDRIIPNLGLGVVLFFVVSAYSLLHSHERVAGTEGWLRAYYVKRIFRIAPLFWFMICIYLAHPFFGPSATLGVIAANFLFVYNFFPGLHESLVPAGWTIGVEMPFYLLLPLALYFVRGPRAALALFAASAAVALVGRVWLTHRFGASSSYVDIAFSPNIADFAGGILAYHLVRSSTGWRVPWILVGTAGILLLATLPLQIRLVPFVPSRPDILLWIFALSLICSQQAAAPSRILSTRAMQWLGERSFGIYLLHPLVIFSLMRAGVYASLYHALNPIGPWAYVLCAGLTAAIVFPAAALTYRLIEMPGQQLGATLIRWLDSADCISRRQPDTPLACTVAPDATRASEALSSSP